LNTFEAYKTIIQQNVQHPVVYDIFLILQAISVQTVSQVHIDIHTFACGWKEVFYDNREI